MEYTFKLRRDVSWRWTSLNPVLASGEPGLESNTNRFKIGDGFKTWVELDYFVPVDPDEVTSETLGEHIASELPHPVYDDGPSLFLLYENAKV